MNVEVENLLKAVKIISALGKVLFASQFVVILRLAFSDPLKKHKVWHKKLHQLDRENFKQSEIALVITEMTEVEEYTSVAGVTFSTAQCVTEGMLA